MPCVEKNLETIQFGMMINQNSSTNILETFSQPYPIVDENLVEETVDQMVKLSSKNMTSDFRITQNLELPKADHLINHLDHLKEMTAISTIEERMDTIPLESSQNLTRKIERLNNNPTPSQNENSELLISKVSYSQVENVNETLPPKDYRGSLLEKISRQWKSKEQSGARTPIERESRPAFHAADESPLNPKKRTRNVN